ncbi:MAG: HNH endonuclease [Deltaproteobacteria bacterium]|nr:HNH endonuclease [Deltaproteobacteria bacterium]
MKGYVGVTDKDWFDFLSQRPGIDEVNFWQPGGSRVFQALSPNEPFFFKLHSPQNYIVGGGFFAHSTILPISLAWSAFGKKNGAVSLSEMRSRTEKYRRSKLSSIEDYKIGCILLAQPFFFRRQDWIPVPPDFSLNIVQGKGYDLAAGYGLQLWEEVQLRLADLPGAYVERGIAEPAGRYGEPSLILPRLGQGTFRVVAADKYERRCAIAHERTLPVLEAAHIKPYSKNGPHSVDNGLLLRSDIHRLFDSGYVTVTTDRRFEVSNRIQEEFDNGEEYRALHGNTIWTPSSPQFQPSAEFLALHNDNVFRG